MSLFYRTGLMPNSVYIRTVLRCFLLGGIVLAVFGAGTRVHGQSQATGEENGSVDRDSVGHPNQTAYVTDRSIAYHILASPAYVLHAATRPVGWTVKYVERRYPSLFEGRLPVRGGIPLIDIGGPVRVMAGGLLYDNALFGSDHEARLEGLYGSGSAFRFSGQYQWPDPAGPGTDVNVRANVFSNPRSKFFLGGNSSNRRRDRTQFARRQADVSVALGFRPPDRMVGAQVDVQYEQVDIDGAEQPLVDFQASSLRPVTLLTPRLTVGVGKMRGTRRPYFGTHVQGTVAYSHDVGGERFRYGRYIAEITQYVPVLILPKSRRLLLRARVEQVEPVFGGEAVPFFQLPGLGGKSSLRGYRYNRFQDRSSLLFTAEYRYPIWSNLDGLLFVDAGQVTRDLSDVAVDRFHWSYGGGIHLLNASGLAFRFEVAGSREGVRTILTVEPNFRGVAR